MFETFVMRLWDDDPLSKAGYKPIKMHFGSWKGLQIIAIGPKGGKIVGYGKFMKPVYAGSAQAEALATQQHEKATGKLKPDDHLKELVQWLMHLGFHGTATGDEIQLSEEDGKEIGKAFQVYGKHEGGKLVFQKTDLLAHVGEPIKPAADAAMHTLAASAAGQHEEGFKFPKLSELTPLALTGENAKYAGSHGNKLFVDKDGRKWIFKAANPTIARAEEAACRLGQLLMGDAVQPAKVVLIGGQLGVLVGEMPGEVWQDSSSMHSHPQLNYLKKYRDQIIQNELFDWLVSNHDAHAGQFLANGSQMVAIDKGQAWKWIGEDKLDPNFKGSNPSFQIYKKFWEAVQEGKIPKEGIEDAAKAFLEKWANIPESQFRLIIAPYVHEVASFTHQDSEAVEAKLLERFNSLAADAGKFLTKQLGKTVAFKGIAQQKLEFGEEAYPAPAGEPVTVEKPAPKAAEPVAPVPQVKPEPVPAPEVPAAPAPSVGSLAARPCCPAWPSASAAQYNLCRLCGAPTRCAPNTTAPMA
jgi:hypothetical protein